ncbi:MBL fold metallo-hydrolase [Patescibacteria group bacterium]
MDITYLGHSSFKIKTKKGVVVTDPYDKSIGIKFPSTDADIVTVSHAHTDHDRVNQVKNVKKVISGPGEYEIMGISIIGIPTFHDNEKGAKRGKNTIYVYEVEDIRLLHLGDLGHILKDKVIEDIGDINVLMIPVGGTYTIGSKDAVNIVKNFEPQFVLPMHYYDSSLDKKTFGKLEKVDTFLKEVGLNTERTNKLTVHASDLGEDQKVVVFESE